MITAVNRKRATRSSGFTLLELIGVVSIIALLFTAVALSAGNVMRANLRAEANKLASNIQAVYTRSVTHNEYFRMVFDLEEGSYHSEVAEKRFFLNQKKEEDVEESLFKKKDQEKQQAGEVQILETTDQPSIHQAAAREIKDALISSVKLGRGISIAGIMTTHQRDIRTGGTGYLYFFPSGTVERSLIYLTDGSTFYTLETQPMTGRVRVFRGKKEPGREFDEDEEDDDD